MICVSPLTLLPFLYVTWLVILTYLCSCNTISQWVFITTPTHIGCVCVFCATLKVWLKGRGYISRSKPKRCPLFSHIGWVLVVIVNGIRAGPCTQMCGIGVFAIDYVLTTSRLWYLQLIVGPPQGHKGLGGGRIATIPTYAGVCIYSHIRSLHGVLIYKQEQWTQHMFFG